MLARSAEEATLTALSRFPAVALIGARQTGKTTLAKHIATLAPSAAYLDLERPSDLAKLAEPELYLSANAGRLVIVDEVHRRPDLFPVLRSLIDDDRRPGRFLILGSASPALLRQSSETLAGRISFIELLPLTAAEVGGDNEIRRRLWLRGGFPPSFLAADDATSLAWREAFVQTYLERDIPQLGLRIPAANLRQLWLMLAHLHGQLWNGARLAASLGVSIPTVKRHLEILQDTFMVRALQPCHANLGKRLVKSPKVYLRDSGLLHALLGIADLDQLAGSPVLGASWEGWVMEQVLAAAPPAGRASFFRTAAGAEIDLVLEQAAGRPPVAVEIKYSASPALSRGFRSGFADLGCERGYVIAPVREAYPLAESITALPVEHAAEVWG